ncbi:hypothetical protein ABN085_02670 [Morganella morganii]|uniref:hypothetical protein n=1 Tax=Morganella morganii TaxID=582 RepID=UPI0032DA6D2D
MATIIDALVVTLKLDNRGFSNEVKKATTESDRLAAAIDDLTAAIKGQGDETKKAKKKQDDFTKSVNNGIKAVGAFFTTILVSSGLSKLISEVNRANDQLYFLSKNLGMSATEIKKWQNMAEMSGGSADGMAASMSNLSKSLWDLVTIGDSSVLPYFNALNVGVVDSGGKLRDLDAILLDVADSLSGMSRPQAYNIAKNMGFDEGTINTLLQGRDAMQDMLDTQRGLVISSEEELEISRQLNKQNAQVRQGWEGLKTLLANYLMPSFLKFSEKVSGFLMFLNKNRDTAVTLFKGIGIAIGLFLIPMALKAATAFMAMFAPLFGGIGLILLLGLVLAGLYDDYETWKKGGDSLFDYSEWEENIEMVLTALKGLKDWFKDTTIGKWFTDQDGNLEAWKVALGAFGLWFAGKWVIGITAGLLKIGAGFTAMFGWPGLLVAGLITALGLWQLKLNELDLSPLMTAAAEAKIKVDDLTKSLDMLRKAENGGDKAQALIRAGSDIIPGGHFLKMGIDAKLPEKIRNKIEKDGIKNSVTDLWGSTKNYLVSAGKVQERNKQKSDDGKVASVHKERGLRYNSPLNLAYANQQGADNTGGWAKFDTEYNGIRASAKQLKMYYDGTSRAAGYKKLQTVSDIIHQWAPKGHGKNDPVAYSNTVASRMGVGVKDKIDLNNPAVMLSLMKEMSKVENNGKFPYSDQLAMSAIQGTGDPYANAANNINKFNEFVSKPIAPNAAAGTRQIMDNSQMLQSGSKTVNNKVEANIENINVHTSASTLSGNVSDGLDVTVRDHMFQLITPMS